MTVHSIPAKFTGLLAVCMLVFEGAAAHAQSAESILQKSRDAYADMKSTPIPARSSMSTVHQARISTRFPPASIVRREASCWIFTSKAATGT